MYRILFVIVFCHSLLAQNMNENSSSVFDEINLLFIPQYQFYIDDFNIAKIQNEIYGGKRINSDILFKNGREMQIALGIGFRNFRLLYTFFTSSDIAWNDRAYGKFMALGSNVRLGVGQRDTFGQQIDFKIGLSKKKYIGFIYKNFLSDGFNVNKPTGVRSEQPVMFIQNPKDFIYFYYGIEQRIKRTKLKVMAAFSFYTHEPALRRLIYLSNSNQSLPITAKPHSFILNASVEFELFHLIPMGLVYNFHYEFASGFYSYKRNGITIQFGFPEL